MKQTFTHLFILTCFFWLLSGCDRDNLHPVLSPGLLPLEEYTAWGDGFTAGFTQASWQYHGLPGLFAEGQQYAYPNLLAQQFSLVDTNVHFQQYLTPGNGSGYFQLESIDSDPCEEQPPSLYREILAADPIWTEPTDSQPDNLAVPYLSVAKTMDEDLYWKSPFASRLGLEGSYLQAMADEQGRMATLWLGLEDVLGYAMTGTASAAYSATSVELFADRFAQMLDQLTASPLGRDYLIVGNIPDPTSFPYFQAMPPRFASAEDCGNRSWLIYFQDANTGDVRFASEEDRVLLLAQQELGKSNDLPGQKGLHRENPLPAQMVLSREGVKEIQGIVKDYNRTIDSLVTDLNGRKGYIAAIVVDLHQQFEELNSGQVIDGANVSNTYLSGGIFDSDGRNLTPRGQAFVANAFIKAINENTPWRAHLPLLDLGNYPGMRYP